MRSTASPYRESWRSSGQADNLVAGECRNVRKRREEAKLALGERARAQESQASARRTGRACSTGMILSIVYNIKY